MDPFGKPISSLEGADVLRLIEEAVGEGAHLDYKQALPNLKVSERKAEFLDDVSAFANARGGCILYGMEESGGVAFRVADVGQQDFDALELQVRQVLQSHLQPPISPGIETRAVTTDQGTVFLVHVRQSWRRPHMARFPQDRFLVRAGAGNRRMDVDDLREAFLGSAGVEAKVREFRADRLSTLVGGPTPFPLTEGATLAVHAVPASAFDGSARLSFPESRMGEITEGIGFVRYRHNLDGLALAHWHVDAGYQGHAQMFRNGAIEVVDRRISDVRKGVRWLYVYAVEQAVVEAVAWSLKFFRRMDVEPPAFLAVSLLGVLGCKLRVRDPFADHRDQQVDRDDVLLDPVTVESWDDDARALAHPLMDQVWQAAGWERSFGFDEDHNPVQHA